MAAKGEGMACWVAMGLIGMGLLVGDGWFLVLGGEIWLRTLEEISRYLAERGLGKDGDQWVVENFEF